MNYETEIAKIHDLNAAQKTQEAQEKLISVKARLRDLIKSRPNEAEPHYLMSQALLAEEEPKQALVALEKALENEPTHQESLWLVCSILLHDLNRPEGAKKILEQKLCQLHPENQAYKEALKLARSLGSESEKS